MLYYKLSNGEEIEIRINNEEMEIEVLLFNGSTVLSYTKDSNISLNDIIKEIEIKYDQLKIEDWNFEYSCYTD